MIETARALDTRFKEHQTTRTPCAGYECCFVKVLGIAVDETIKFDKVNQAIQHVCFAY